MSRFVAALVFASVVFHTPYASTLGSQGARLMWHGNWVETENETLWRHRYTNEDYGHSVLLGHGAIGHGTHSPAPNHGFLVSLPDIDTVYYVKNGGSRFIWVDATYDVSDDANAGNKSKGHSNRISILGGRHAIETSKRVTSPDGPLIEESILVRHCGIIYTVNLRTTQKFRATDRQEFEQISRGFRFLKIPASECVSSR